WEAVYGRHSNVRKLVYTLAGYVGEELLEIADRVVKPDSERTIDVGYRARTLDAYMGRGAREKAEIGLGFLARARDEPGLTTDISVDEVSRIYGRAWFEFLADCRAVLGVEAGVSIFDLEDEVRERSECLTAASPGISFEELSEQLLAPWEDN